MKRMNGKRGTKAFTRAVGRVLRRAAKVAGKTAEAYHTPILYLGKGQDCGKETLTPLSSMAPFSSASHFVIGSLWRWGR